MKKTAFPIALAALLLSACGGSGNSSSSSTPPPPPPPPPTASVDPYTQAVTEVVRLTSETSEPQTVDSVALSQADTAEPTPI